MVENLKSSGWLKNEMEFRQMETMQIDKVHDGPEMDIEEDDVDNEEPYFANPDDKVNSPRITGLTAISIVSTLSRTHQSYPFDYVCKPLICFSL